MNKDNTCCEDIIRHDEQLKTVFHNIDKAERNTSDEIRKIDEKIDKVEKIFNEEIKKMDNKIDKITSAANKMVYSAVAVVFMAVINIAVGVIK